MKVEKAGNVDESNKIQLKAFLYFSCARMWECMDVLHGKSDCYIREEDEKENQQ